MAPPSSLSHVQGFTSEILLLPTWALFAMPVALFVAYNIFSVIHSIYFHPLSRFPGPKLAASTKLWFGYAQLSGRYVFKVKELHDKYGPVVRLAPNTLSYSSASSWKQIYGHVGGRKQFLKTESYDLGDHPNLVSIRDPVKHGEMRKLLSHAFSTKALSEQEEIVHEYVDLLIKQININAVGKPKGEEMVKWYNYVTFDIIGDLAFGAPFGSLANGNCHFWIKTILENIKSGLVMQVVGRFPLLRKYRKSIIPKRFLLARQKHIKYTEEMVIARMNSDTQRKDFMGKILEQKEAQQLSLGELKSQANVLIVAGSETTATFLSGVTYHLSRNKEAYNRLAEEIRSEFQSYDEINGHSTDRLKYLRAVIDEGLRSYPPVPIGMPRHSPGETIDGDYVPAGVEVFTSSWSSTHSENNFHRPYEFIPERWIDPECKDKREASQPFLLGSRVCLGRNLALLEMRVILAKMFFTYDFELMNKNIDWLGEQRVFSLWKKPEIWLNFTRRPGVVVPPLDNAENE